MRLTRDPMRYNANAQDMQYLSKNEGRKMLLLGLVLLMTLGYVFQQGFSQKPMGPEIGLVPNQPVDARTALETLQRVQDEQEGTVAPVATPGLVELDHSILEGVTEGPDDVDKVIEPAFFHLLSYVHSLSDEQLATAPEELGSFEWEQLITDAGRNQARGQFVRLRGRFFTRLYQRVLPYPNEAGLAWVWQGTFRHQNRGYFVTITDKNFEPKTGVNGTPLELVGAFLKVYPFRPVNAEAGTIKTIPHVVVKSMKRLPEADMGAGYPTEFAWAVFGSVVLAALCTVVYAMGSRKGARQIEAWRAQRLKGKMDKVKDRLAEPKPEAKAETEPEPATEAPSPAVEAGSPAADAPSPAAESPSPVVGAGFTPALAAEAAADAKPTAPVLPPCPACNESCGPDTAEAVVCAACLQRHHGGCWDAKCASCGGSEALVRRDS